MAGGGGSSALCPGPSKVQGTKGDSTFLRYADPMREAQREGKPLRPSPWHPEHAREDKPVPVPERLPSPPLLPALLLKCHRPRPARAKNTYLALVEEAMFACHTVSHSWASRDVHSPGVGEDLLAMGISCQQDQRSRCCYHP